MIAIIRSSSACCCTYAGLQIGELSAQVGELRAQALRLFLGVAHLHVGASGACAELLNLKTFCHFVIP